MKESLEELIRRIIDGVTQGKTDQRVEKFEDYKSKYVVLAPTVKVEVALTDDKTFRFDVTDYFKGDVK